MHTSWHCRHCGMIHIKDKPIGLKKYKLSRLLIMVRSYILDKSKITNPRTGREFDSFTKESIAKYFNTYDYLVEQCLHKLNLEGLITKAKHRYPHDREIDSSWCGDLYYINKKRGMKDEY